MPISDGFLAHILELVSEAGPITARRMFGGAGLFAGELMVGLVIDDTLYLKADETTRPLFEAESSRPFTYTAKGRQIVVSHWQAPDRLYDDPSAMTDWVRAAIEAARRAEVRKPAKRKAGARKAPASRKRKEET